LLKRLKHHIDFVSLGLFSTRVIGVDVGYVFWKTFDIVLDTELGKGICEEFMVVRGILTPAVLNEIAGEEFYPIEVFLQMLEHEAVDDSIHVGTIRHVAEIELLDSLTMKRSHFGGLSSKLVTGNK
jgi:hypothetical protein